MRPNLGDNMSKKRTGKSTALVVAILETEEDLKKATKNQSKLKFQEKAPKSKKS